MSDVYLSAFGANTHAHIRAPFIRNLTATNPHDSSKKVEKISAVIDTSSDVTRVPLAVIKALSLVHEGQQTDGCKMVRWRDLDNKGKTWERFSRIYRIKLEICNSWHADIDIIAGPQELIFIGRDVLEDAELLISWGRTPKAQGPVKKGGSLEFVRSRRR